MGSQSSLERTSPKRSKGRIPSTPARVTRTGKRHDNETPLYIVDSEFRIQYAHVDWKEEGHESPPWQDAVCFKHLMQRDVPCPECGAREAFKSGRTVQWLRCREGGEPMGFLSVPVSRGQAEPLVINLPVAAGIPLFHVAFDEDIERFKDFALSIADSFWELNERGVCTYCSREVTQILGYQPEDLLGKRPFEFLVPEDRSWVEEEFLRLVELKEPARSVECWATTREGGRVCLLINGIPFFDRAGRFSGYRGITMDITGQKTTEQALKERETELSQRSQRLEEVNTALKVLLEHRDEERRELEGRFLRNVERLVLPHVQRLRKTRLDEKQASLLSIVETCLKDVVSPFLQKSIAFNFTPRELEVADLIRQGCTTKEIAELLHIATSAVDSHRNSIRNKLGIRREKVNLQSRLLALS